MGSKRKGKEIALALGLRLREGNEKTRGVAKWEEAEEEVAEAISKVRKGIVLLTVFGRSKSLFC